ncbi:ABC transporter substrate-binding protein [Paraburkholderia caledonica]|uniref:ABC transporter substrate-binding protein n=1 Tax=Paraburkholderia caledonica TaxID=134536 RepID=UPI00037E7F2D|nr:ABC transporter substrate-binding protein [Paraburkholderia caledonica]
MRLKRRFLGVVALAAAVCFCLSTQTTLAAEKITLIVGGYEKQAYLPAKLTESLGYFKAEGLDVELLNEPAGVDAENQLLAGVVQGVVGFYDHCVDLQAKGKSVESVVQFSLSPGLVEMASGKHPEIRTFADLKGKTVGVTGLGSSTDFLTLYLASKAGLKPGELSRLPVGAGATFMAAMQQDQIQAGISTEPTVSQVLKGGARVLVDLRTPESTRTALGGTYPGASLYMATSWVDSHKDVAQKLANAFVKTLRYVDTHSAAEIADKMPKDFYLGDKDDYVKALAISKAMFTADGVMPADGPRTVYAVLSQFSKNVQGKNVDLYKTYTTEFVKSVK